MTWTRSTVARALLDAEARREDRTPFTDEWTDMTVDDALAVQSLIIDAKVEAGERVVGVKLGLTSRAKQQRMGVTSPLTAVITDGMSLDPWVPLNVDELIHPRVEPEIVFVMAAALEGPGVTPATAMAAVGSVHAGLEVIDSRYRDFRFTLADVLADNASSARFVVRPDGLAPTGLDLGLESVSLWKNGRVVATATGAAVQGHPAAALALAANELGRRGQRIEAGALVLTGGLTDAVAIAPGDVIVADFAHLGVLELGATAS